MVVDPEWRRVRPDVPCGTGVLLLPGSSGRVDVDRGGLLARHGADVLAIRWFGGPGQQPGPYGVPLELFLETLDGLAPDCDRLAIVGTSFGAEAALLVASLDPRVSATVAFAPSAYVWAGYGEGRWTSHWTLAGAPMPYVGFDPTWEAAEDPPAFRELYRRSLAVADPAVVAAAMISVERIRGEVVLVAGGDQVWPAADFADAIARRRRTHGLDTTVVTHPDAGHRILLPGETPVDGGQRMLRGGSVEADRALGAEAWPVVVEALRLRTPGGARPGRSRGPA